MNNPGLITLAALMMMCGGPSAQPANPPAAAPVRMPEASPSSEAEAKLKALESARQAGILTDEEYQKKKAELLRVPTPANPSTAVSPFPTGALRLKTHSCLDPVAKIEAIKLLMPVDWRFEGGVRWLMDCTVMPANVQFRVSRPQGADEFEVFPNQVFFWDKRGAPPTLTGKFFGAEIRPPLGAAEALQRLVLPRFRGSDLARDLRILEIQSLPQLAQALKLESPDAQAAKARIEYTRNGVPMEEEIYGVVEQFPVATMPNRTFWFIEYTFSFKARKGDLQQSSKLLQTIAFSCKPNPRWLNKVVQVKEMLIAGQIQIIRSNAQLSDLLARTSDQIRQENLDQFNRRQEANDRLVDNFCQGLRGVQRYQDPYQGDAVELPSGYPYVYANNLGEYLLTESPSFNPGESSNLQWQPLQPLR